MITLFTLYTEYTFMVLSKHANNQMADYLHFSLPAGGLVMVDFSTMKVGWINSINVVGIFDYHYGWNYLPFLFTVYGA